MSRIPSVPFPKFVTVSGKRNAADEAYAHRGNLQLLEVSTDQNRLSSAAADPPLA